MFRAHTSPATKLDQGQMSARRRGDLDRAGQQSSAVRRLGRITLRFRVTTETRRYYRWLERLFERYGPRRVGFFRFLCCALIDAWKHALGSVGEYAEVYARDRYRCTSPVCGRRGVTPHHLRFRSAGGDDSAENLSSLCVWCHLEGIHGGRLQATPPASNIGWVIGRMGHTLVHGRQRERRKGEGVAFEN
jgi:hypothetical protein